MIATNVRLLLVTNQYNQISGIVTSNDVSGEKIMRYLQQVGGKRADVMVRDIMTPRNKIEVIDFSDIQGAKVGDLVETLKRMGRQHALVTETLADGTQVIRGVISASQIGKQLGVDISTSDVASNIMDLASKGGR